MSLDTVPNHCQIIDDSILTGKRHIEKGAGRTYFTRRAHPAAPSASIERAADADLASVLQTRFLSRVLRLHIYPSAAISTLPDAMRALPLRCLTIESAAFDDWESVYALPHLEELLISKKAVGSMPPGIAHMPKLRRFEVHANGITALPSDLNQLDTLRVAATHRELQSALQSLLPPALLLATSRWGWSLNTTLKTLTAKGATTTAQFEAIAASGLIDEITSLTIEAKSSLTGLPNAERLSALEHLLVSAPEFNDWPSVYRLTHLKHLTIKGKVSAALPDGISALRSLETLWIAAKAIVQLPNDLGRIERLDLGSSRLFHPALRAQLPNMVDTQQGVQATRALKAFEAWLTTHAPDYLAKLQPGLSEDAIDAIERRCDLRFPRSIRALYRWRNGDPTGDARFTFLRQFLTLEQAVDAWQTLTAMQRAEAWAVDGKQPPGAWSERWFPFCRYDNGLCGCVDLTGTYKGQPGQIVEVWLKDDDRDIVAPHLGRWLSRHLWALEAHQITKQADGDWLWGARIPAELYAPGYPLRKKTRQKP